MASIDVSGGNVICPKCGKAYGRAKGNFSVNYGELYRGAGHVSICKNCVDEMYNNYLSQCGDARGAVRQVCRKLDLYWSDKVFDAIAKKNTSRTMMTSYITKINTTTYLGKSYDDTLKEEGSLWKFGTTSSVSAPNIDSEESRVVPEEVRNFWGPSYDLDRYEQLEKAKEKYIGYYTEEELKDVAIITVLKQICEIEVDLNKARANGSDPKVIASLTTSLNHMLGAANLKPVQKKEDEKDTGIDKQPMGVWIKRYENERPIPDPDPELRDVDGIIRYITIWFLGHLCKMLNIRNSYCKLYEQEMEKRRVDKPEYEDEDTETLFNDIFASGDSEE